MWIQLGNDLVNLETSLRVELDGPLVLVREPDREFRANDPGVADEVEGYLREHEGWIALREHADGEVRRAMYVNLATTTSIQRVDDEYRLYAGEAEYASISARQAGALEAALAERNGAKSSGPRSTTAPSAARIHHA